jgi:hypothetical protein
MTELAGVWRRSLLTCPDGRQDTTTTALWVQGPGLYVDLRQPASLAGRPEPGPVLFGAQEGKTGLGSRQGFAGQLVTEDGVFEWCHRLDLSPPGPYGDRGWLTIPDDGPPDALIEDGHDVAYLEHWRRLPGSTGVSAALGLTRSHGAKGVLVRAGSFFALACGTPGVASDCEISIGRIQGAHWMTIWSSRRDREGELLSPYMTGDLLHLCGPRPDRGWRITAVEGKPGVFSARETGK